MASEMDIAWDAMKCLSADITGRIDEIETEQDARLQIINRVLTEVLGWQFASIKTEANNESGYTDYLLRDNGKNVFVIEAKRVGKLLVDTRSLSCRSYKISGPAILSASDGISQAASYCLAHGTHFAAVTTGTVWIAFLPFPTDGRGYLDGNAILFPSISSIIDNFAKFYDLFSMSGVRERLYKVIFNRELGLGISEHHHFEPVTNPETIKIIPKSSLGYDLENIFREFFGSISGDDDPELLLNCFVETRESRVADDALEKIVQNVMGNILPISLDGGNELAHYIETSVDVQKGDTVLVVGNKGAGKSTFIERFFKIVLARSVRDRVFFVKVNLQDATGHIDSIIPWLTNKMINVVERSMFLAYPPFTHTYHLLCAAIRQNKARRRWGRPHRQRGQGVSGRR